MEVHTAGSLTLPKSIIAIGAFDGIHRGHQAVIRETVKQSKAENIPSVVYTFDPPPRAFFQHAYILTSVEEKIRKLQALGVDHVIIAPFNRTYVNRSSHSFIKELKGVNPIHIRVGEDFRFGNNREGDVTLLKRYFNVQPIPTVCCMRGKRISSTRIRQLILKGDYKQTEPLLGWSYEKVT